MLFLLSYLSDFIIMSRFAADKHYPGICFSLFYTKLLKLTRIIWISPHNMVKYTKYICTEA